MTLRHAGRWTLRIGGLLLVLVAFAALGLWWMGGRASFYETVGCGELLVLVDGHLLDEVTGEPLGDARIVAVPLDSITEDEIAEQLAEQQREINGLGFDEVEQRTWWIHGRLANDTTRRDGWFQLRVRVSCTQTTNAFGRVTEEHGFEPRQGIAVLHIERQGREPMRLPVPAGRWVRTPGGVDQMTPYATWHLGKVMVPR